MNPILRKSSPNRKNFPSDNIPTRPAEKNNTPHPILLLWKNSRWKKEMENEKSKEKEKWNMPLIVSTRKTIRIQPKTK